MIKLEKTDVYGWEAAIRGMRNPMNSWKKSDSFMCKESDKSVFSVAGFQMICQRVRFTTTMIILSSAEMILNL